MSEMVEGLELSRCGSCQAQFLPTDGPCPHCGSTVTHRFVGPALGTVLCATELVHPAVGWENPHRLAIVEVAESVRILAVVEGELPAPGSLVSVRRDGDLYRARPEPAGPTQAERGEGESPRVGGADTSFEPPR